MNSSGTSDALIERQSLETGKWGNLLMAVAGVVADGEAADRLWLQLNEGFKDLLGLLKSELVIAAQAPYEQAGEAGRRVKGARSNPETRVSKEQ